MTDVVRMIRNYEGKKAKRVELENKYNISN